MNLILDLVTVTRGSFTLSAEGTFSEGFHLVSGPVGSGKSTLALLMAGLLAPDKGAVHREAVSSSMLSLQFPEYHLTSLTLADECRSWGLDPDQILPSEGFRGKRTLNPLNLSRGELKRFHLACVLAKEYDLLLLDEPFSALDCRQKEILCNRIAARGSGITIIFTHEREILPPFTRCWRIRNGELEDHGTDLPYHNHTVSGNERMKTRRIPCE